MAGKIKGITIEIGGDVSSLNKALKDVNKKSRDLQGELRQVERLLKLDPRNTELVAQKQKLLGEAVANTKEKLETLREAQKQVQEQFERGEISEEQYRALQREIIKTEQNLKKLEKQMQDLEQEEQDVAETTKKLETFFKATDTSVDKFADTLGADLTNAIKKGEASSKQLDDALDKVGQAALGADADLDRMKKALASVDDGNSLANVRKELDSIEREAKEAGKEVEGLGIELENIAGALAAGGGIAGVVGEALDMASLDTQIDVIFSVPEESKKAVKDAVRDIEAYGVDAGEALEGVRRQWALNKDASDEMNTAVTRGAAAIARAYQGIDFTELIQENNEISRSLDISNEAALGLVGSLLKAGFPPEQLDIISEYGTQLKMAGYNAEEIQAIFAAGVETGTWNIDNLLDGLKEGRIRMAEFGQEIPKAMQELLAQTDISAAQFQKWGQQVAAGGEGGKQAMQEVAQALMSVDDETTRNAIGVQIFGTMWEDQGTNVADTLLNMNGHLTTAKENQDKLNQAVSQIDSDPSVKMTQAINDMKAALEPILSVVADVISVLAEWASNNPTLVATIVAIVTILGVVIGICAALAPILVVVKTAAAAMGVAIGAIAAPIAIAIAAIAAIIAIGVLLWKNWDTIKAKASEIWENVTQKFNSAKESIGTIIENLRNTVTTKFNQIKSTITTPINNAISTIKNGIGSGVSWITSKFNSFRSTVSGIFNRVKSAITGPINDAITTIKGWLSRLKLPEIKIPKIKLPHFKITGKFDLVPPGLSVPKISVSWYDEGGIFRNPAIIGVAERRPEFVGALDDLRYIVRDELQRNQPVVATAGPEVHLHIGTLVADDMGLKKLEQTLRKYRIYEDQRRGGA